MKLLKKGICKVLFLMLSHVERGPHEAEKKKEQKQKRRKRRGEEGRDWGCCFSSCTLGLLSHKERTKIRGEVMSRQHPTLTNIERMWPRFGSTPIATTLLKTVLKASLWQRSSVPWTEFRSFHTPILSWTDRLVYSCFQVVWIFFPYLPLVKLGPMQLYIYIYTISVGPPLKLEITLVGTVTM